MARILRHGGSIALTTLAMLAGGASAQNLRADKGQGRALQMDNPVNIYYTYVSTPEQADDLWAQQIQSQTDATNTAIEGLNTAIASGGAFGTTPPSRKLQMDNPPDIYYTYVSTPEQADDLWAQQIQSQTDATNTAIQGLTTAIASGGAFGTTPPSRKLQMDNPPDIYYTYVSTPEQADDLWAQQIQSQTDATNTAIQGLTTAIASGGAFGTTPPSRKLQMDNPPDIYYTYVSTPEQAGDLWAQQIQSQTDATNTAIQGLTTAIASGGAFGTTPPSRKLQMDNPVNIYYTYVSTPEQADDLWAQQIQSQTDATNTAIEGLNTAIASGGAFGTTPPSRN